MNDLTGARFGKLLVLKRASKKDQKDRYAAWVCLCDCGRMVVVSSGNLRPGTKACSISCGIKIHGLRYHPIYKIYDKMILRCTNPGDPNWKHYGDRGVKIYPAWLNRITFYEDNIEQWKQARKEYPLSVITIERKDVNGHYEPLNVSWIPQEHQSKNRRKKGDTTKAYSRFLFEEKLNNG